MKNIFGALLASSSVLIGSFSIAAPPEDSSDVVRHLEFIGYDVSMNSERISAKHPENPNILIKKYQGGMLVVAFYGSNDNGKRNRDKLIALVNELNSEAVVARYYIDKDGDMGVEGYYPGKYNKNSFSTFIEKYNLVTKQLVGKLEELKNYFK